MGVVHADSEQPLKSYGSRIRDADTVQRGRGIFLSQIVTGDETWQHYWMPECKSTSMAWKMTDKIALRKFKEKLPVNKILATIF